MKRMLSILVLLLSASFVWAAGENKTREDYSGVKWGQAIPINMVGQFTLVEDRGDIKIYTKGDDGIRFHLYKNKFAKLTISIDGDKQFYNTRESKTVEYGIYEKPKIDGNVYVWDRSNIRITLTYNSKTHKGEYIYIYKPLETQINK